LATAGGRDAPDHFLDCSRALADLAGRAFAPSLPQMISA
jgi:hypothetical protein